ncbi:MAG: hypothetical protein HY882_04760 [Deltaproteobacteria bacterium]|nr:hypothetical protein [Deltaproteobacteria bacterium]
MRNKALALIITLIFLIVSSACSHAPKKPSSPNPREEISSQKEIARSLSTPKDEEPWWKKDEHQFGLMVLIILGVALATSASIWIYFNTNGLTINIWK